MKHTRLPSSFLCVQWLCWLLLLAGSAWAKTSPGGPGTSLAQALRADGSLRPGAQGTFDARQFRMTIAPDGRPHFQPAATTGAGDNYWQPTFGMAGPNYVVRTVVQAGNNLYVGGEFSTVGSIVAHNIAKWDGTSWSTVGTGTANGVNGTVYALAVVGPDLYVGGRFSQAGGQAANSLAKWNGTTWSALGTGLANTSGNQIAFVNAITPVGTALYVGGSFTQAGSGPANNIAKWDGTAWSALGTGLTGVATSVNVIVSNGPDLYVAGSFNYAGGLPANCIAKWNGTTWSSLGSGIGTTTNGIVSALLLVGPDLYAGGGFDIAGGVVVDGLAKWNGTSWSRLGGAGFANGRSNGIVTAMAMVGADLYISGLFQQAYGSVANYLAKWNGTTWAGVGTGIGGLAYGGAHALVVNGSDVYVAGQFARAGDQRADNIARWDGAAWHSLGPNTSNVQGMDAAVYALGVAGTGLYAGGGFREAGGAAAEGLARWNGTSWTSLYTGPYTGMQVRTVAVAGTDVYVGGSFYSAGPVAATNVAKWDGTAWSSLGTGSSNGVNGTVTALAVVGRDLYVGGTFTQAGGASANNIAKWNGTSWSPLGTGASNGIIHPTYSFVQALAVIGTDVYVGGQFATAGGTAAKNLARWDGTQWRTLSTGPNGPISVLAAVGTSLYVGGSFTLAGSVPANRVAVWDGSTWSSLGTGTSNGVAGFVYALAVAGSDVYVGGRLTQAGGSPVQNLAKWNGSSWSSLGTGTNGDVRALAVLNGRVYAGGFFTAVADESKVMNYIGSYDPAVAMATTTATAQAEMLVYPNPASQALTLTLPAAATTRAVQLLDNQGRLLRQLPLPAGVGSLTLSVGGLPAGIYLVRCGAATRRLVIQ